MDKPLAGKTAIFLVCNGFEELDMTDAQRALLGAGAAVKIASLEKGAVNGWYGNAWGHYFPVDKPMGDLLSADYDMVILPGGARSVAKLADSPHTRRILAGFIDAGKPVAALGEGVELLIAAQKAKGVTVAATEETATKLTAAEATVSEEPVVVDGSLITGLGTEEARAAFVPQMVALFSETVAALRDAA